MAGGPRPVAGNVLLLRSPVEHAGSRAPLVSDDLLGLYAEFTPRFVRRYAELRPVISEAVAAYAADVRARRFPGVEHCFGVGGGG